MNDKEHENSHTPSNDETRKSSLDTASFGFATTQPNVQRTFSAVLSIMARIFTPIFCSVLSINAVAEPDHETQLMQELRRVMNIPGSQIDQSQAGWIIIDVSREYTRYFFTSKKDDAAFPAIFVRKVEQRDGKIYVSTDMTCNGEEKACNIYFSQFKEQDRHMRKAFSGNDK